MFIEITGAVVVGVIAAVGIIAGVCRIVDNWPEKKVKDPYALPYDVNSPLVKRFQYLAGITDKYGSMNYYRSRFNKVRYC